MKLTVSNKKAVRQEFDGLVIQGQRLGEDWVKFYFDLSRFWRGSVNGTPKYQLCGFSTWQATLEHLAENLQESVSTIKNKLGVVDVASGLTAKEVQEIGKVNLYEMKKLQRAGLLTGKLKEHFKYFSVEDAKALTAKTLGVAGATPRKIALLVEEGQWSEFIEARERFRQVTGNGSTAGFVSFWLGYLASLSDKELAAAWEGEGS